MPPSLIAYAVLYRRLAVRHFPSHHDPFCGKVIRAPDHALQYAPADSISAIYLIISLGANEIVMTKQATLGPIDPSLYTALNPRRPEGGIFPVSVEAVKGYLEFAKNELGIQDEASLASIFEKLTDFVHPPNSNSSFMSSYILFISSY